MERRRVILAKEESLWHGRERYPVKNTLVSFEVKLQSEAQKR